MQNLKNNKKLSHKQITTIGVLCACMGILLLSYNYINTKINYAYDYMNIKLLKSEQPELSYDNSEPNNESDSPNPSEQESHVVSNAPTKEQQVENDRKSESHYIGTLEIPKLSFTRGFLEKSSTLNNVNKNIAVMSASDYPDTTNGNFIIAGHSGNSSIAFFQYLYQLEKEDIAYVTYKGKKYTYQIKNIYLQPKVGHVAIYRDTSKKTLTLITCTKDDSQNQTIYIAELIKEENI